MVRRIASQVHKQVARLMRAGYLKHEPAWYKAVLDYPPLTLPPKAPPSRSSYDLPPDTPSSIPKRRVPRSRPLPIQYIEDDIRRQFFRDHPFETYRPVTLVENAGVEDTRLNGEAWTRLRQRGRNPSPEEYDLSLYCANIPSLGVFFPSCIRFAINLYEHHEVPLTMAYSRAVAQFRSLRSEHHVATTVAVLEAEAYGSSLGPTEIERGFMQERKRLDTWARGEESIAGAVASRKRWKAIVERQDDGAWTKGQEYVRLWKEGIRPTYSPALTEPAINPAGILPQAVGEEAFMDFGKIVRS
jgi:small subunit ribosomal protein S23